MDVVLAVDDAQPGPADSAATLDRLTAAVQALAEAIAPGLVAEVRLVGSASSPAAAPVPGEDAPGPAPVPAQAARPLSVVPRAKDGVTLDLDRRVLLLDGAPVVLTRREFELMAHFHRRRGVALGRRELMQAIWDHPYVPGDRTVDVHVRRLRVKLGRHADRLATLRGYGYRFG